MRRLRYDYQVTDAESFEDPIGLEINRIVENATCFQFGGSFRARPSTPRCRQGLWSY